MDQEYFQKLQNKYKKKDSLVKLFLQSWKNDKKESLTRCENHTKNNLENKKESKIYQSVQKYYEFILPDDVDFNNNNITISIVGKVGCFKHIVDYSMSNYYGNSLYLINYSGFLGDCVIDTVTRKVNCCLFSNENKDKEVFTYQNVSKSGTLLVRQFCISGTVIDN